MNTIRLPHVVNGALLVGLFAGSLSVYPTLPEQIPHHFNLFGRADAYWQTTLVRWLFLPILAVLSTAALYGPAWIVGAVPASWLTVPNQAQYEALPPSRKQIVMALVRRALYWMATATLLLFLATQASIYYVATTTATALPVFGIGGMVTALLGIGMLTGWLTWRLPKRIRALSEASDGGEGRRSSDGTR